MSKILKVKNIDDLKKQAIEIVELPGWGCESFVAKLKRPSLMSLVVSGIIPNTLMKPATEIFNNPEASTKMDLNEMGGVLDAVVKAALVDPTYDELTQAEIELTDEQRITIFNYTQSGVKALEKFREDEGNNKDN